MTTGILRWSAFVFAVVASSWLYFGSLGDHLLDTHDVETFRDNIALSEDFWYFFAPVEEKQLGSGRPVAELVKWLVFVVFGNDPRWFHLSSVFLHGLATVLLALWLRRSGEDLEFSWCAALLFLVNVGHFQAVHYISAMDYPLALSFALASLLSFGALLSKGGVIWRFLWLGFLGMGALCHISTGAVLPLCVYWHWQQNCSLKETGRFLAWGAAVLGLAVASSLMAAAGETSTWQALDSYANDSGSQSTLSGAIRVLLWLVSRLITTAHWLPLTLFERANWELYLGALILALLVLSIAKADGRIRFWALWIFTHILPFALLNERIVLDMPAGPSRYLYAASAGSSVILASLLRYLFSKTARFGRPLAMICYFFLLVSSFHNLKRVEALSFYTSGRSYISNGDNITGAAQLRRAIEHSPQTIPLADAYTRLSYALLYLGEDPGPTLETAITHFPDKLWLNTLGAIYMMETASPDSAHWRAWLDSTSHRANAVGRLDQFHRNMSAAYRNLAEGYFKRDRLEQAVKALTTALRYEPERISTRRALAKAYVQLGIDNYFSKKREMAKAAFDQALLLEPDNVEARINLGWSFYEEGMLDSAINQFQRVLRLNPSSHAHFNLALCYLALGKLELARNTYAEAIDAHGTIEGHRIGAVNDLRNLISRNVQVRTASGILGLYWGNPAVR